MEELKQYLKENPDKIKKILEYFNYHSITVNNSEIRCAKPNGENASTCRIKLNENLSAVDFSSSFSGDIVGLIKQHTDLSYKEIINTIKTMTSKKVTGHHKKETGIFDDFFEDIYLPQEEYEEITYDVSILDKYSTYKWNERFLKDGILPCSQYKFHIGYDEESNRITIPWFNESGEIVGIMGRLDSDEKTNFKYLPLIPFPKHNYLYGLWENKLYIMGSKEVFIFESEKSVMLGDTLGYRNFISLGGNTISTLQVEMLLRLGVERFIICLDEGLDVEIIKKDIKTIKDCCFMRDNVKVGVILDKENKHLPKGSKASPIDLGKDVFEELKSKCMIGG